MILIRADANQEIGTGHVMRCMSIAHALKRLGQQVCFVMADESGVPLLEKAGQEYRILHSDYRDMENELPGLKRLLAQDRPDFFLADSYFVTSHYLREVRRSVSVGAVDDMMRTDLPVDLLINYNIFADASLYGVADGAGGSGDYAAGSDKTSDVRCRYLLGTDYVPLRSEFEGIEYSVREKAETVLVTTGGSDRYNIAGQLLEKVLADPYAAALQYLVVSGAYNVHLPELKELESAHENVHIFSNVRNMSGLMRASDIAVSAGGSTMYELSAVGVPVICFSFADNQERIVRDFVDKKLTCFGGDYLRQGEAMFDGVVSSIHRLAGDCKLRQGFHERMKKVVDGRGAMRIAERLCAKDIRFGHM